MANLHETTWEASDKMVPLGVVKELILLESEIMCASNNNRGVKGLIVKEKALLKRHGLENDADLKRLLELE